MTNTSDFNSLYVRFKNKVKCFLLKNKVQRISHELNVIIGAEKTQYDNWIPTNINSLNLLDAKSFRYLFGKKRVKRFLAEHVFEHLTYEQASISLMNCNNYLHSGGKIRIAVPDGFHPNPEYIEMVKPGGFGQGADDHKVLYNYQSLSKVMEAAGLQVSLLEYYDEHGQFHYTDWNTDEGHVMRSRRFDKRFHEPIGYSSLIIDGIKG